jgi:hypothetical protein
VLDVTFRRPLCNDELIGDLPVRHPLRDQLGDRLFALGELRPGWLRRLTAP